MSLAQDLWSTHTFSSNTGAAEPNGDGPDWLKFVPEGVRGLVQSHLPPGLGVPVSAKTHTPQGACFLSKSFSNEAGTRPYRLYVPSTYRGEPVPLVVMLHGCSQSPDDFAAGTGMNDAAERSGCLVAYPGQTAQAHVHKCWKWFSAEDQQRDAGEPSLIAGITRQVMQDYAIDPRRVFVAGLSAGGAAAAIMGATYPELYAAIGVHSGLACGAARDLPTALAVMKRGGGNVAAGRASRGVPAIVFHGERDATVSPLNGDDVIAQSTRGAGLRRRVEPPLTQGGRECTRSLFTDPAGRVVAEQWLIHGAGHAWSGGRADGSFTDPSGPDATAEMLRFFSEHPLQQPGSVSARIG